MHKIILALIAVAAAGLTGCSLLDEHPYKEVNYYDLGTPKNQSLPKVTVKFTTFRAIEAAKYKMIYHEANSRVLIDDYNKWIQTPCFMLNRYLQFAFCQPQGMSAATDQVYEVSGTLFTFKIDLEKKQVVLGVSYVIRQTGKASLPPLMDKSVRCGAVFEKRDGLDFALAMTKAVEELATNIRADIKQLEKKK
jgi:hypothetical protein